MYILVRRSQQWPPQTGAGRFRTLTPSSNHRGRFSPLQYVVDGLTRVENYLALVIHILMLQILTEAFNVFPIEVCEV